MAKQQQATITAQHLERTDANGNPQVKKFTVKAWNDIPMQHFMSKEQGLVKNARQGWVQIGDQTAKKAPEPLKKAEPKAPEPVVETPKVPTAPKPFVEGQKV
jgi:hypothetical protein